MKMIVRRALFLLMFVMLAAPLLRPLGLPLTVGSLTKGVYDMVEDLPTGSRVNMALTMTVGLWAEVEPATMAVLRHLFTKPVKIIIVSYFADAPKLIEGTLTKVADAAKASNKRYGEDFVNLGFVPGLETGMAAFTKDSAATTPSDIYGTPVAQLPAMSGVRSAKDFALVIVIRDSPMDPYIRQYVTTYGAKLVTVGVAAGLTADMPYYKAGQILGIVAGVRGGAEYELLMKSPGPGVATTDALSLGFVLLVVLAGSSNVMYAWERMKSRSGKGSQK